MRVKKTLSLYGFIILRYTHITVTRNSFLEFPSYSLESETESVRRVLVCREIVRV